METREVLGPSTSIFPRGELVLGASLALEGRLAGFLGGTLRERVSLSFFPFFPSSVFISQVGGETQERDEEKTN